ncbi:class I SAM-dependent RNA methyltransferase [Candidatus Saccharibacteria bacterium]|nr:class I SAM-dependent RNA methyltransferase [Candidatus Saccharibacteria bacterium]
MKQFTLDNITLVKLVHGGQCIADSPDGKKVFVWGGLPGEVVNIRVTKKKSSYLEGIVTEVLEPSNDRIVPVEPEVYLSSSPWQIMTFEAENKVKQAILEETFEREGFRDVDWASFIAKGKEQPEEAIHSLPGAMRKTVGCPHEGYRYRNKVELGFWGDEDGLHYASYVRGTHGKQIITRNALASDAINYVLDDFLTGLSKFVEKNGFRAGDFKTAIFRSNQAGEVVAALFTKLEADFSDFMKPDSLKGLVIYHSNPKSPASVPTRQLYIKGDIKLNDEVLGKNIMYDVLSFFQVNLPVFEQAALVIKEAVSGEPCVDFYSGVGTIGIPVGADVLVDSDESNIKMARKNALDSIDVIHATSENATDYIASDKVLIVDPPRAGMHKDVVERVLEVLPPKVVYLGCNPSTQARDVNILSSAYKITYAQGYNFFPRTPHIESLVVLERI